MLKIAETQNWLSFHIIRKIIIVYFLVYLYIITSTMQHPYFLLNCVILKLKVFSQSIYPRRLLAMEARNTRTCISQELKELFATLIKSYISSNKIIFLACSREHNLQKGLFFIN